MKKLLEILKYISIIIFPFSTLLFLLRFWGIIIFAAEFLCMIIQIIIFFKTRTKYDAIKLLKETTAIKLIQIPAFVLNFLIAIACLGAPLGFLLSILFWIIDSITICISGTLTATAIFKCYKSNLFTKKELIIYYHSFFVSTSLSL